MKKAAITSSAGDGKEAVQWTSPRRRPIEHRMG